MKYPVDSSARSPNPGVRFLSWPADGEAIRDAWGMVSPSGATLRHYQLFEWFQAMVSSLPDGDRAVVAVAEDPSGPIAVLAVRVAAGRVPGHVKLTLLDDHNFADWTPSGRATPETFVQIIRAAGREPHLGRWLSWWFRAVPQESVVARTLPAIPRAFQEGSLGISVIPLDHSLEHILGRTSRNFRQGVRTETRRLAEAGGGEIVVVRGQVEVRGALDDFLRLEARGWKGREGKALLSRPEALARFGRLAAALTGLGRLRVEFLTVGGDLAAGQVVIDDGPELFLWRIAFNEHLARLGPGKALLLDLLRREAGGRARVGLNLMWSGGWHDAWPVRETATVGGTLYADRLLARVLFSRSIVRRGQGDLPRA